MTRYYAFNDVNAMMAFVGAGNGAAQKRQIETVKRAASGDRNQCDDEPRGRRAGLRRFRGVRTRRLLAGDRVAVAAAREGQSLRRQPRAARHVLVDADRSGDPPGRSGLPMPSSQNVCHGSRKARSIAPGRCARTDLRPRSRRRTDPPSSTDRPSGSNLARTLCARAIPGRSRSRAPVPAAPSQPTGVSAAAPLIVNRLMSCTTTPANDAASSKAAQRLRMINPTHPRAPAQTAIAVAPTDHAGRAACNACWAAVIWAMSAADIVTSLR